MQMLSSIFTLAFMLAFLLAILVMLVVLSRALLVEIRKALSLQIQCMEDFLYFLDVRQMD